MEMRELLDRLHDATSIVLRRLSVPHNEDAVKEWGSPHSLTGEELRSLGVYWDSITIRGSRTVATSTQYTQVGVIITLAQTM